MPRKSWAPPPRALAKTAGWPALLPLFPAVRNSERKCRHGTGLVSGRRECWCNRHSLKLSQTAKVVNLANYLPLHSHRYGWLLDRRPRPISPYISSARHHQLQPEVAPHVRPHGLAQSKTDKCPGSTLMPCRRLGEHICSLCDQRGVQAVA